MSLTDWVEWDKGLFDIFTKPDLDVKGELKAPAVTQNYGTVGAAFDYALRLLVNKENANLVTEFPLVARHGIKGDRRRREFIEQFEIKRLQYIEGGNMDMRDLLPDCVVLAKLESTFRSRRNFPNSDIFQIDSGDIDDLMHLLSVVDVSLFRAESRCLLNPTFGQSSRDVGGADADLVIDDRLIDIKTTKHLEFTRSQFRQLLGYYILNEREGEVVGELNHLGVYYSRFGVLYSFEPLIKNIYSVYQTEIDASIEEYQNLLLEE